MTLAVAFMMLVVPLSSCITDNSTSPILSDNNGYNSESLSLPSDFTITYHNTNNGDQKLVRYNGNFAYAARLFEDENWKPQDGKVFAGWSKSPPNSESTLALDNVNYLVYDDIKSADVESSSLDLYTVWIDDAITSLDGESYRHIVYISAATGDDGNTGDISDPVKSFERAYDLLDPSGTTTSNRIIIIGEFKPILSKIGDSNGLRLWGSSKTPIPATISGYTGASIKIGGGNDENSFLMLKADTVFENIKITRSCKHVFFYCCGNNLTMGESIDTSSIQPLPDDTGKNSNNGYAIPDNYPALTVLGGGYAKGDDGDEIDSFTFEKSTDPANSKEFIIKLLSGVYGRVSGFGRSYEDLIGEIETLCPTIVVADDARVGTLAVGHLDSNATTGFDEQNNLKTAKIIIWTNSKDIPYYGNNSTTNAVVYLVGSNIGNGAKSTFIGNVNISIYDGIIENIYGAGLGRVLTLKSNDILPQTSMSGAVYIKMCGGTINGDIYGGGAAAALDSQYAKKVSTAYNSITSSLIDINISGGEINGDIFGGGYGKSVFMENSYYFTKDELMQAGTVNGNIYLTISDGTITGDVYGGGSGVYIEKPSDSSKYTSNSAKTIGNTSVLISGGTISGSVYGGSKGVDGYADIAKVTGDTSIYVSNGSISGNVYGGGSIAVVSQDTHVTIAGGTIGGSADGGRVFGGGKGTESSTWAGQVTGNTNVSISNGKIKGSVYGGGYFGAVGTSEGPISTATINISGTAEIAGSVYGGGRGYDFTSTLANETDIPANQSGLTRGNIHGTTKVIVSGGNIGYLYGNGIDSEDAGSVYGGGKLGIVTGSTNVEISGGGVYKNVFGGGKGQYTTSPVNAILGAVEGNSNVNISSLSIIINGSVYGGGELGIVGTYASTGNNDQNHPQYTFTGGKTSVMISDGTINENVYGGGKGDPKNIVSGATGSTSTVISGNTSIDGSVYGGGAYGLVGNSVTATLIDDMHHPITDSDNKSSATIVILGGKIGNNVFGGGYGPNATVGGSTHVCIGKSLDLNYPSSSVDKSQTNITIAGNVYGGGEMGSVGFIDLVSDDGGDSYHFGGNYSEAVDDKSISSNVFITGDGHNTIKIGSENSRNLSGIGNVYGGGKGGDLTVDSKTYKGYAIVHGSSNLTITGKEGNSIHIYGDVFGAGQGVDRVKTPGNMDAILYAAVTKSSNVYISDVNIYHDVYGGGELSIVGWYYDDNTLNFDSESNANKNYRHFTGSPSKVIISDSVIYHNVYGGGTGTPANALSGAVGKTTVVISDSTNIALSTSINGNVYGGGAYSIVGTFTVDRTPVGGIVTPKLVYSPNDSESNIIVLGKMIGTSTDMDSGNIFGGGYGPKAVIAGSTHIYIGKPTDLSDELENLIDGLEQASITIYGNVYGGGEMGAVGFEYYSGETIATVIPGVSSNVLITSDSASIQIDGNVYGGGKGWDLEVIKDTDGTITDTKEIKPSGAQENILHGYAIVHGNTVVNISGSKITIDKCVYGGGEGVLLDGAIITESGPNHGRIDYEKVLGSLLYGQVTGSDSDEGASVSITDAKVHENVYGGGNTGLIGIYAVEHNDGTKIYKINYLGKPVSVTISGATIGVIDASGHISQNGGDDLTTGNVFGAGKGNDEGILLGAVGSSKIEIKGDSHIVKVTNVAADESLERAKALSGNVYGGGDYGIVGNSVTVQVDLDYNYNGAERYDPFKSHKVTDYSTTKDIITVLISGSDTKIDGNVYGGGKGTFDSHTPGGGVILDGSQSSNNEIINPTMSAGYGTVYGSVKVAMSGGTVSGNVYGGGKGSLNESTHNTIINSIPYGQITGIKDETNNLPDNRDQQTNSSIAASVLISGGTVNGSVFGGGQLGILGTFTKSSGYFDGKDTLVVIFSNATATINNSVFGGGEGAASSAISGTVRNTLVIIGDGAVIGDDASDFDLIKLGAKNSELRLYHGNVYGGGKLSVVGNVTVDITNNVAGVTASAEGKKDNTARTDVIILGGEIKRNVYGGGFSPKASIAGDTHVWIGSQNKLTSDNNLIGILTDLIATDAIPSTGINESDVSIKGSVFGGGEMGAVGSSVIKLDEGAEASKLVSANVSIKSADDTSITINGSVFGGGEGVQNYASSPTDGGLLDIEISGIKGYAIVRGSTHVDIEGKLDNKISNLTINGSVYGGGKGVQYNVESIHYAEVYDSAAVKVNSADIEGSVYGGGNLGVVGHFYDAYPEASTQVYWYDGQTGQKMGPYPVILDNGKAYIDTSENGKMQVTYRNFCSDYASEESGKTTKNVPAYVGKGTAAVLIEDSNVEGNVYGGGEGVALNILAGAVGRGTVVTIDDKSVDNSRTVIGGNVYGGGKNGIVGSILTEIIGTGGIGTNTFSTTKVLHVIHSSSKNSDNLDLANDVDLVVNIYGGHIKGSVFGAGKGEQVYYENVPYPDATRISYYKLSAFGRTEVNISNGIIDKHVYGGSENGETGSLTILNDTRDFTTKYWNDYNAEHPDEGGHVNGPPSDIPGDIRDKHTIKSFSAAFVNIVGGTIYGNVFGGGYFGAVHGNTHVHIGWNAMMPDPDNEISRGDCHYYNNYDDVNYKEGGHLPFVKRSEDVGTLGEVVIDKSGNPTPLAKKDIVHNLFLNGTIYAGGDRGDPTATSVNYDYISVYGTSHIFINGFGYFTGSDSLYDQDNNLKDNASEDMPLMYIQGSLFGSGNSCTTFYSDKTNSRFITIRNYNAVNASDELNKFTIYSIQRATEVTITNSSIRLPGRSDGSNSDVTALYSLNHINVLILRGGSTLILDTEVNDLREFRSIDGTGANTTLSVPSNTLQLNNGIILIIAENEEELNAAPSSEKEGLNRNESSDVSEAASFASLKKFIFGSVSGYTFVNLDPSNSEYYGGYIYGQYYSSGGFAYGSSFDKSLYKTEIKVVHYEASGDNLGYDVWKPTNGVVSSSSTIVADENKVNDETKSHSQSGFYETTGSVTLPMTVSGSIYELRGYNIIPSQAASVSGDDRSLRLLAVDKNGKLVYDDTINADTDFGLLMSLNEDTFAGSIEGGTPSIWIDPTVDTFGQKTSAGAVGGNVLPQLDFTLYFKNSISKTGIAGEVVIYLQERLPVRNTAGAIVDYIYGDQIKVVLTIQTQNIADDQDGGELDLYPHSVKGVTSWYFVVPPMGNGNKSYDFTLDSVSIDSGSISLNTRENKPNGNNQYQLIVSAVDNQDRSHGWSGFSLQDKYITTETAATPVGTTDGRFGATLQFTLINDKEHDVYETGTVEIKFTLKYTDANGKEQIHPLTLNVNIKNKVPNYTVDFITDKGASYVPSQIVDSGNTVKKPADPSMIVAAPETQNLALGDKFILGEEVISLEFGGWYADENYETKFDFKKPITGNTKVYALFSCKVTFDSQGGSGVPPDYVIQGKTVAEPADPVKNGYTFTGWYLDGAEYDFSRLVTYNITLTAKWTVADVYIEYNMNGSSNLSAPIDSSAYQLAGNSSINLSSKYNANTTNINGINYKFAGWALTSSKPGKIYSSGESVELSEVIDSAVQYGKDYRITFYAVWIPVENHQITITADPVGSAGFTYSVINNDGTKYSDTYNGPFSVKSGSIVKIIYSANNGYTFVSVTGCDSHDPTTKTIMLSNVTNDQNITVKFIAGSFDVILDANGGKFGDETDPIKIQVTPGEKYPSLENYKPTREHYNFLGWFTSREGSTEVTKDMAVLPDVTTLYAHWELIEYTVTFYDTETGTSGVYSNIPHGYAITLPLESDPFVREGFKLTGWKLDNSDSLLDPGSEYGPVTSNHIFYAQWGDASDTTHTVIFNPNGGTLIGSETVQVTHGASIGDKMPSDPIRDGYEFLGWFTAPGTSTKFTSSDKVVKDITVYAHWGKLNTITFDSNGGSKVDSITGKPGDNITKPADPTKSGYIFAGWYEDNSTFQNEFVFDAMPSRDITLYAKWVEENDPDYNFKVSYNANGGSGEVPGTEFHYAGSTVTVKPADLKNNECRFLGWQSSADGKLYQPGDTFRMPFKDVCLTAVWSSSPEDDKVTVTFCVDNETYAKATVNAGTTLNERMPSVPEKEGCIFAGWFTSDGVEFTSETAVYADITVYAKWNLKEGYTLVTYIIDNEIYMTQVRLKSKITEPYIPNKSGKELNGWYYDKELQNKFDFNSVITEDHLTLYAEWKDSSNFMIWFIFVLFAFFIAAVVASAKKVSFYKDENDEEKYASVILIGKGTLKDKFPQSPDNENFAGWYSEEGELVTEDTEIKHSMKLHARWKD